MRLLRKQTDVTGVITAFLAVECVSYGEDDLPMHVARTPLRDMLRALAVTLPVSTSFTIDRPGAI